MEANLDGLSWPIAVFTAFILMLALDLRFLFRSRFPRVGWSPGPLSLGIWPVRINWILRGHDLVKEQYDRAKHENYVVHTLQADRVVLAPKYLEELRMLPEDKLNSAAALVDRTLGVYNGVDIILDGHLSSNVSRVQLTKNLPNLIPVMAEELEYALGRDLCEGSLKVFESFKTHELVSSLVFHVTSRVFVGLPVCRNEQWTREIKTYQNQVAGIVISLMLVPEILRPLFSPFNYFRWRMSTLHQRIRELLFVTTRNVEAVDDAPTVLKMLIQSAKEVDEPALVSRLLVLSSAALHTTTVSITHALHDLCSMPQLIEPLRDEARIALACTGGSWTFATIKQLAHLDSFLKESQRMNHPSFLSFTRKVMSPITLSDGTRLHLGTLISLPAGPMAKDPIYYESPEEFISDRFLTEDQANKANKSSKPSPNEFTSIEPGNLAWGSGRFTCPGRWYASVEMKLIIAVILMRYDLRFPDDQDTRLSNWYFDDATQPSRKQEVLLRSRF